MILAQPLSSGTTAQAARNRSPLSEKEKAYLLVLEAGIRWLHRIEALGQSGGPGQRHQPVPILQASGAGIEERSAIELYGEDQSAVVFRLGKPGMVQNRLAAQVIEIAFTSL